MTKFIKIENMSQKKGYSSTFKYLLGLLLIISLITLIFNSSAVFAQESPHITVEQRDNPLIITGTWDAETTSFSGNVRLTLTEGEIKDLQLLSSELTNIDNSEKIDRSNITIPTGISLSEGQPRDVRVTVNNVTRPGKYNGNLEFISSGKIKIEPLKIPLTLDIDAKPNVIPEHDNLNIEVVRCPKFLGVEVCGLATWLLPDSVTQNQWTVQLDNQTLLPVKITDANVVMQGQKTGNIVNPNQISLKVPNQELEAQKVEGIDLIINRNQYLSYHVQE